MQRVLVVGVLALLLALQPVTAVADTAATDATLQEFERVEFTIHVSENGTARWTFSYQRVLSNQSERRQFEAYAEEFSSNTTQSYRNFVARAEALTRVGANETDRDMDATGFSKRAYVQPGVNDVGVVEMSFQWTNFAAQSGDRVVVGDVFEGGLTLASNQTLVVTWDDDLAPTTVEPKPGQTTDDSLVWRGQSGGAQFLDQQPRVVFAPAEQVESATPILEGDGTDGATPGADGTTGGAGGPDDATAAPGGSNDLPVWPFAFGAVVLVALGGLAFRHGYLDDDFDGGSDAATGGGADGGGTSPPAAQSTGSPEPSIPDEELLSDEDRVHSLLAENGGRMKQVNIVDRTGWSKSKVSMLLSEMEEDGEIHKLRVGRENIISRAGDEPDATRPTFDDE